VPTIRDLSEVSSLSGADAIPVSVASQSDARKASLSTLLAFIEANFASPDYTTQINAPSSSGSSIMLDDQTGNLWLIINPTGAFAALTLVLPLSSNAYDGQQILVTCTNSVGILTINGNGATLVGAPTGLGVGGFFTLRYNKLLNTWYCVSQSLGSTTVFSSITLTSAVDSIKDVNGRVILALSPNYAGAGVGGTNFVAIANDDAGGSVGVSAQGVDTNIGMGLSSKGTGTLSLTSGGPISINAGTGASTWQGDTVTVFGNVALSLGGETASLLANGAAVDMSGGAGGVAFGRTVRVLKGTLAQANTALALYADDVGARATITDATVTASGNFGAVITGGGANIVPAYHDGTNWRIG
jgi:hypothetical protein